MTKPINLYTYTRCQYELLSESYFRHLVRGNNNIKIKEHEYKSLQLLVNEMIENGLTISDMDGFFYGFVIPQIGKEFDLLKLDNEKCINIELKSTIVDSDSIEKQLKRNSYYLSQLGCELSLYTIVTDTMTCYELYEDVLYEVNLSEIIDSINSVSSDYISNINELFHPSKYLVSPLNNPERFLNREYFLNQEQENIKNSILQICDETIFEEFFLITGKPGTGKTLLLYDLARLFSSKGKTLIIHCGITNENHRKLANNIDNLQIIPISNISASYPLEKYEYILLDESHRIHINQLEYIYKQVIENSSICVFSLDSSQILSRKEKIRKIEQKICKINDIKKYEITNKVRTNAQVNSFVRCVMDLRDKPSTRVNYENISLLYAENITEAQLIIDSYRNQEYEFINYSKSQFNESPYSSFDEDSDTHHVLGQEFEAVIVPMGKSFYYSDEGELKAVEHPNPDYLYTKLFFQAITRARTKLAIVVVDNPSLFKNIASIFNYESL